MQYPKEVIAKVLHLHSEGMSLSKTREYMYQHEGYKPYNDAILRWEKKYGNLLSKVSDNSKPKVKGRIHTDEKYMKKKGKVRYQISSIDSKTKYNVQETFVKKRSKEECRQHFKNMKSKIGDQVKEVYENEKIKTKEKRKLVTFVSDGFEGYRNGAQHYFGRIGKVVCGVPIASRRYGLKHNNNPVERHNEDISQRYKIMRGFKSDESADAFLKLRTFIYNFVRPHQGLGRTPAEAAECNIPVGRNRLLGLISYAAANYFLVIFSILNAWKRHNQPTFTRMLLL